MALEVHVADVVGCASKVQQIVTFQHHLIDSGAVLLRFGVAVTCPVDKLVHNVMKPQEVCVGVVACEVVSESEKNQLTFDIRCTNCNLLNTIAHKSVDVKLIIAVRLKQLLVACKIIEQNGTVINHAAQRVIDNCDLHTMSQKLHDFSTEAELGELVGCWCDENIAPMEIAMLELKLLFSDGESQCGLEKEKR